MRSRLTDGEVDAPLLLCAARVSPEKNLDAVRPMLENLPYARLAIVGDGPARADLERHYAGLPGKAFAKVLEAMWTGVTPSAAYWNRTRVVSDNRIAALATDTSEYGFDAPGTGPFTVDVTLLFRRAFIELMQQKGWRTPDLVMASQSLTIRSGEGRIP